MSWFPYSFECRIVPHDLGTYRYTVAFLPADLAAQLPFVQHPRLRISGELNGVPFSGAWQPSRGRWYMMLSKPLLRDAGCAIGDLAEIRFRVEDQDSVDIPGMLTKALESDARAMAAWQALSVGKRRGLAHRISAAKTAPTASRRLAEVLAALRDGTG